MKQLSNYIALQWDRFADTNRSTSGKMVRTSEYVKLRVLALYKQNKNKLETVQELRDIESIMISQKTVGQLFKKFKENASLADKMRDGWPPIIRKEHYDFINLKIKENDELTAPSMFQNHLILNAKQLMTNISRVFFQHCRSTSRKIRHHAVNFRDQGCSLEIRLEEEGTEVLSCHERTQPCSSFGF